MDDKILYTKKTKSLSKSGVPVDAEIIAREDGVFMRKEGDPVPGMVEKDPYVYNMLAGGAPDKQFPVAAVQLHITSKCNLDCLGCYEKGTDPEEPGLEELYREISKYRNVKIRLMGKEPTCREDLTDIIKMVNRHNRAILVTNGLRLADIDFVKKLKKAGLKNVVVSLNSLDDAVYEKLNGRPLAAVKIKALENLKKAGLSAAIAMNLYNGLNEGECGKLLMYCMDNFPFITELRIRAMAPLGGYAENRTYCMSEVISIMEREMRVTREHLFRELLMWKMFLRHWGRFLPGRLKKYFAPKLCSVFFHVRKNIKGEIVAVGSKVDRNNLKENFAGKFLVLYEFIRSFGAVYILTGILNMLGAAAVSPPRKTLRVVLRCWPNVNNIDLDDMKKCTTIHSKGGNSGPACQFIVLQEISRRL